MPPGGRRSGFVEAAEDKPGSAPLASNSLDDVGMALRGRPHQRGLTAELLRVRIGAAREQQLHGVRIARIRRQHQHRLAFRGEHGVRVFPGLEETRDHGRVAVDGGEIERLRARAVRNPVIGARVQQQIRQLEIAALHGPVQGRHAVRLRGIDVDRLANEGPNGLEIAVHGGIDDGRLGHGLRGRPAAIERHRARRLIALVDMVVGSLPRTEKTRFGSGFCLNTRASG